MGTAIRSGSNRAIEAAQAAMASPLLEAGAIDGARGILINITGSSSLKLSEVNEASSLIQSAAHEDANIIFGAVLDEKMGEEVKITVIATGFRDQMPERRARMLSVEEAPVLSVPMVAVPVEAPNNWLSEKAVVPQPAPEPAPAPPPRFKSEDEDEAAERDSTFFYSSSPAVATTVTVSESSMEFVEAETEFAAMEVAPARADFDEMAAEPGPNPPPRDYAADFSEGVSVQRVQEEPGAQPEAALFTEGEQEQHRDLDVPAFLRRLKF
jgi:cell division protein FtsZ